MPSESTKVVSFRILADHAPVVERATKIRGITPAEFMRRAVMAQVRSALLADAPQVAASERST